MARTPKAKRYAQALFAIAREQGKEQAWLDQLSEAAEAFSTPEVALFMSTPRVPAKEKLRAAADMLRGKDEMVRNLVGLLLTRQSVGLLGDITQEYRAILDESLGRVYADVTSAVPVSAAQQDKLRKALGEALDKEVVLNLEQDPGIIGGLTVRVGDQIIDGSVRSRLEALRQRLAQESLT